MQICSVCGTENVDVARFCLACGTALNAATPARREERRVVSVIFVDLVGFTSRSETLDPEDVRAILAPYHDAVRSEIESFGGVVEKFIGDAVMGVFGAPTAFGDDAERAVPAALFPASTFICGSPSTPATRWSHSTPGPPSGRRWSRATSSTPPHGSSSR